MSSTSEADIDPTLQLVGVEAGDELPALRRGESIGRYIVIDELGRGGMGQVVAGYDPELDRRVAIKLLRDNVKTSRGRERMLREAQAMAQLAHPNVVAVYDAGTHLDRVFIAMEFIEGKTLREWLGAEPRADWAQTLDVLVKAGTGLAAAHAVGIVHRDFKPTNVMVGDDGRVRVLDFGLARRFDDGSMSLDDIDPSVSAERSEKHAQLSRELTEAGTVLGTPRYMAPEQFFGGTIDARTDQFAFCIVAYRALFGVAPFAGATFDALGRNVATGNLTEPTHGRGIPRRVRQAILRGLCPNPPDRFETMDALLAELAPRRGGRRRIVAIASVAALVTAAGAFALGRERPPEPCASAQSALDEVYNPERTATVEAALAAHDLTFAADISQRAVPRLDQYASRWREARLDACEATHVRGDQSENLMDLRVACLDGRRRDLDALLSVLEHADADVVEHAIDGVDALRPIAPCSDADALLSGVDPPQDAEVARKVDEVRAALSEARALETAGKLADALAVARREHEVARDLDYPPILAESANELATLQVSMGEPESAIEHRDEALFAAIASGHEVAEAEALLGLTAAVGLHSDAPERALRHGEHARAAIARLGDPPAMLAKAWLYTATTYGRLRKLDEAAAAFRKAVDFAGRDPTAQRILIAALGNLGTVQGLRGDYAQSLDSLREARRLAEDRLGPAHPSVIKLALNVGSSQSAAGLHREAIETLTKLRPVAVATLGPRHPDVARIDHNISAAHTFLHEYAMALEFAERAYEIKRETLGPDHHSVANSANNVGDALNHLGRPAEALAYFEEADRIWKEDPNRFYALEGLASVHLVLGHVDTAVEAAELALELAEKYDLNEGERGRLEFILAKARWEAGDRAEARAHAERARRSLIADGGGAATEAANVDRWLLEHPAPRQRSAKR